MNQSQRDVKEKLLGLTHSKRVVTGCGRRGPLRRPWGCHDTMLQGRGSWVHWTQVSSGALLLLA